MGAGRDEAGFAGGLDGLVFGLLIFVTGTLIAASAWGVVDTKFATAAAAREAARSYVEASDPTLADAAAIAAAREALSGYGRPPGPARVHVTGGFQRCGRIVVQVDYPAPMVSIPFVGRVGRGETVTSRHAELVDPYRSGTPGGAGCA
jgi:hypothetical protein